MNKYQMRRLPLTVVVSSTLAVGDCGAEHGVIQDQRGLTRPDGDAGLCDIGAFELFDRVFSDRFESQPSP